MRKILCIAACMAVALPAVHAQYRSDALPGSGSETRQALHAHVEYFASRALEGRAAGSEGEKDAAEYVFDELSACGVEMFCPRSGDTFGIIRGEGDTLTSRNVMGIVQGYDPVLRDRYVVIGARLDNLAPTKITVDGVTRWQFYPGANGNASGLSVMLELAKLVSINSSLLRRSVIFVGFGASKEGFAGSWYFLNRSFSDVGKIDAMIGLDMLGAGDEFYAYDSSNSDVDALIASVELPPIRPVTVTGEPYPSDHRAFYAAEIPSVLFTRGVYPEHDTPRDVPEILDYGLMELELEYVFSFTRMLANADNAPRFRPAPGTDNGDGRVYQYDAVDAKPTFMGSYSLRTFLEDWVYQYLKYPQEAVDAGVQGTVHVQFLVDRKGNVTESKVVRSAGDALDAEALRVVNASPKWKPAKKDGKTVTCRITIPIEFKLTDKNKFGIKK